MAKQNNVISIYIPDDDLSLMEMIKNDAERLGMSVSDYVLSILRNYYYNLQNRIFGDMMATPKIQYPIDANVRFRNIDPLSYFVLTKLGINYKKFRDGVKKYGVPSIFFVKNKDWLKIAEEVNRLLDKDTSGKLKWYIINANVIAKEKGIEKLLEVNKEIWELLSHLK